MHEKGQNSLRKVRISEKGKECMCKDKNASDIHLKFLKLQTMIRLYPEPRPVYPDLVNSV